MSRFDPQDPDSISASFLELINTGCPLLTDDLPPFGIVTVVVKFELINFNCEKQALK